MRSFWNIKWRGWGDCRLGNIETPMVWTSKNGTPVRSTCPGNSAAIKKRTKGVSRRSDSQSCQHVCPKHCLNLENARELLSRHSLPGVIKLEKLFRDNHWRQKRPTTSWNVSSAEAREWSFVNKMTAATITLHYGCIIKGNIYLCTIVCLSINKYSNSISPNVAGLVSTQRNLQLSIIQTPFARTLQAL